jgi:hypothetical protein
MQVNPVNNKQKYRIYAETLCIVFVYSLSLIGIHYLITGAYNFTNQDSLIILIPVFLISFPAIIYGYQIGIKRFYKISKIEPIKRTFFEVLNSSVLFFLITILIVIGLYLIIIERSYAFGVVVSLLGAAISIPISKKLYDSLGRK